MKNIYTSLYILIGLSCAEITLKFETCLDRCDYDFHGHSCYKYHEMPAIWHEAELRCFLEGGTLTSPTDYNKNRLLNVYAEKFQQNTIFTGIRAKFSRGDFFSVEGIPLRKLDTEWAEGEPNNADGQNNCIAWKNNTLLAVNCNKPLPYLCYRRKNKRNATNTSCGTNDNGYQYSAVTKKCYKFHRKGRTWSRAYMACAAELGQLLVIRSDSEARVIKEIYAKNPIGSISPIYLWQSVAFVGFHDWDEHGTWRTVDGQTLEQAGYNRFAPGEPKNTSGEFCGAIERSALLDDFECERPIAFICEKNPNFDFPCKNRISLYYNEEVNNKGEVTESGLESYTHDARLESLYPLLNDLIMDHKKNKISPDLNFEKQFHKLRYD